MSYSQLIQSIQTRSDNYHVSLWSREAKIASLTQRIHQVGGMVELARLLRQPELAKALYEHCQVLAKQRAVYQRQSG